jgi:hypothetical protein
MTQLSIEEIVNEKIMLVNPSLSLWQGRHDLKADKTEFRVNEATVEEKDLTTPSIKLFTKEGPHAPDGQTWHAKLQSVVTKFTRVKKEHTLNYNLGGVRILPVAKFNTYISAIYGYEGSPEYPEENTPAWYLKYIQDTMPTQYSDLINYWQSKVYWPYVEDRIPSKEKLAKRFKFSLTTFSVGVSEGVQKHLMEREMATVSRACRSQINDLVSAMIEEPRRALAEAIEDASKQITEGEVVTRNTLNSVRSAIAQFKAFDFIADAEIMRRLQQLETAVIAAEPRELANNPDVAALFTNTIRGIGRDMLDSIEPTMQTFSVERGERFMG